MPLYHQRSGSIIANETYLELATADAQLPSVEQPFLTADEGHVSQGVVKVDNPRRSYC